MTTETTTMYCAPCDIFESYADLDTICRNCHGPMVPVGNSAPVILDGAQAREIALRGDRVGDTIELRPALCSCCGHRAEPEHTDKRTADLEDWLFYCSADCRWRVEYEDAQFALAGF